MPLVKICGTTSPQDLQIALEASADFVGVIRYHKSPRHAPREVLPLVPPAKLVLVTVNHSLEESQQLARQFSPRALQLHGDESPEIVRELAKIVPVWKVIHGDAKQLLESAKIYTDAGAEAVLVDARETQNGETIYGGTGQKADWNAARALVDAGFQVILAGGLSPENVARAIQTVNPWMVDVVSGVEQSKGVKDPAKVQEFIAASRESRSAVDLK